VDFSILQDGGRRHLGILKCQILTDETIKRVELHHRAKFHDDGQTVAAISQFLDFLKWRPPPAWILTISNF